jgi:hypothetical protein
MEEWVLAIGSVSRRLGPDVAILGKKLAEGGIIDYKLKIIKWIISFKYPTFQHSTTPLLHF